MTENKRFTLFYEKTGKYFDMGIIDHETNEPFDETTYEFHQCSFKDTKDEMEDLCLLMNDIHNDNEQLKIQNNLLMDDAIKFEKCSKKLANNLRITNGEVYDLKKENEQLKHFIQGLTTKGTTKIHLADGSIYNVNAILIDFKVMMND